MSLLPHTARLVDEFAARAQSTGRVPSLALAVVRDGELLHLAAAGDHPRPGPDLQYRIGSITKTVTAAIVLQLRDEGFLALDDRLDRHLPGVPVGEVTLRDLLSHVSGLRREPDGAWWERREFGDVGRLLADLTAGKRAYPAGKTHHYSNLGYGLLGAVLLRVTGETWAALAGKRVLEPLDLTRTSYHPAGPYAPGYVVHPLHGTLHEEPRPDAGAMAPAGQLWSTVTDMATWAAYLASPAADEMCRPVVMLDDAWTAGHGLGPELYRAGERVYAGHGGSMPGYVSQIAVHRPSRTGVVGFANAYGLRGTHLQTVALDALTAVLDAEPEPVEPWRPPPAPTGAAAELCGRWWWMGREYDLTADGPDLVITCVTSPRTPWRFAREAPDRWRGRSGMNDGELMAVRRDPAGAVVELDIATFVFGRDPSHLN